MFFAVYRFCCILQQVCTCIFILYEVLKEFTHILKHDTCSSEILTIGSHVTSGFGQTESEVFYSLLQQVRLLYVLGIPWVVRLYAEIIHEL